MADSERDKAIKRLIVAGWCERKPNKNGYTPLYCTCGGRHMIWLHKTPSNPNHFREKADHAENLCRNWLIEQAPPPDEKKA